MGNKFFKKMVLIKCFSNKKIHCGLKWPQSMILNATTNQKQVALMERRMEGRCCFTSHRREVSTN